MKKFIKISVALLMVSTLMLISTACGGSKVIKDNFGETYVTNIATIVTYKVDGQNVNAQVEEKKSLAFQGIFNKIAELEEKPDCKFSKDFMVTIEEKKYLIAQDGCNFVKHNGKYYKTTVSDRMILNDIFKEYGAKIADTEID